MGVWVRLREVSAYERCPLTGDLKLTKSFSRENCRDRGVSTVYSVFVIAAMIKASSGYQLPAPSGRSA